MARSLSDIAQEIRADWAKVNFGAKPYLDALDSLNSINDAYGQDSARSIVAYFLSNATTWRGPKAKEIKAELKKMMSGKGESIDPNGEHAPMFESDSESLFGLTDDMRRLAGLPPLDEGKMIMLPKDVERSLPKLYSTEKIPAGEKIAAVKYFHPMSNWTWYGVEYDPNERLFFGLVDGHETELGYFSLDELESVKVRGLGIERDMHWRPRKLSEIPAFKKTGMGDADESVKSPTELDPFIAEVKRFSGMTENFQTWKSAPARLYEAPRGKVITVADFLADFTHKLVQMDMRLSKSERKHGGMGNMYRMGLYLEAKEKVDNEVENVKDASSVEALLALVVALSGAFEHDFPPYKATVKQINSYIAKTAPAEGDAPMRGVAASYTR